MKTHSSSHPLPDDFFKTCIKSGTLHSISSLLQCFPDYLNLRDHPQGLTLLSASIKYSKPEIAEWLLHQGANPNISNFIGETPLHFAADNSDASTAEILLNYKADPNCMTVDGESPLHHSAFTGDKTMINLLLSYGANPNCVDSVLGRSPLHCAVQCEHLRCVMILLQYGADPHIEDSQGLSAFALSTHPDIQSMLRSYRDLSIKTPLNPITEILEEDKSSFLYSDSSASIRFSLTDSSRFSRPSSLQPSQKFSIEDTTASYQQFSGTEDSKLLKFLKVSKLLSYKDVLISNGFDDFDMILYQMSSVLPITHEVLENIGMVKHGHRARMLMRLEEAVGVKNTGVKKAGYMWECCEPRHNFTPGVGNIKEWLSLIKLQQYLKIFQQAGYEDLHFLVSLMNSRYPINEIVLCKIGVNKVGYRMRILAKLKEDANSVKDVETHKLDCVLV